MTVFVEPQEPFVARSRRVESVVVPFEQDGERWLRAIQQIASSSDRVVALPATDRASALLTRAEDRLPPNVLRFERSDSAHTELMDKGRADSLARRAGVLVPWTARVLSREDLWRLAPTAPWPCVVKPVLSHEWRRRFGEARAFLAEDGECAERLLQRPLNAGLEMLLCQYIPGGDEDVEEAIVVRLADGSYPVRFGCRKLRQCPPSFGVTALGESSELPETMALAERVLDEADFVGVAGVEAKRHRDTGERWFVDANVRLPAQWGLGDACGAQATPRLIEALCGQKLGPSPRLRAGVGFVQPDLDWQVLRPTVKAASSWRRPVLAWDLMRPYLGARELGLLDLRDPGPLLAFLGTAMHRRRARLATHVGITGRHGSVDGGHNSSRKLHR